ncbi:autotransporter-associated beta strand repeat-containing protein [Luteolibacter sp. SL250]|uniref:beta strand repeat-containing protein n=1 Tax=Luteolibacter sp. SL250 TaxID=2995170 RepID=UPI0022705711|nr:autotransporter-associated beta strand repeat-containing protein [Luteolibacter sp. SL250]WAC21645.1 autotransporter-associated beta strand repeat-containing protein [Luteolibacter sp. SL250]
MKPSRLSLFPRVLVPLSFAVAAISAHADPINWTGASNGVWSLGTNWAGGNVPAGTDVATFSQSAAAINVKLDGNQTIAGLETLTGATTNVHTLLGETMDRVLTIGELGINHFSGGLTIGSTTAGQKVDVVLAAGQKWNSARGGGSGTAQAVFINNNVTLATGLGTQTLELTGTNTGAYIGGVIGNEAGSTLNILKTGAGVWTLNGANTYSGTTQVNEGTLRLGAVGVAPSSISVAAGATLSFRTNGGMTSAQIDAHIAGANLASGAFIALDTNNGGGTYEGTYNSSHRLFKTSGNNLLLTGTINAAGGMTISEGGLVLSAPSLLTGNVTVASNAALILRAGGAGFSSADITSFRSNATVTYAGTSYFGLSTANGDFTYGGVLPDSGTTRFTKQDTNTLFLTAQNTYTGGTQITNGTLSVSDIKNGSVASQMGASSNVANGIILAGGRLQYTGAGSTTNRLFNLTATSTIEASGTGALVFNNTGTITAENGSRTLYLTGYSDDDNRMGLNLANVTTGTNTTAVIKNGSGKWILSGNNTHTGATTVRGGTLVLDYSGGKNPISATGQVTVQNGTVEFLGSGPETVNTISLAEAENGFATLRVTGGMALTANTLSSSTQSQRHILIDLLGAGNSLTATALAGNASTLSNGLLTTGSSRANVILRANDGTYGFAARTGTAIEKLSGQTDIAAGTFNNVTSNTTNYRFGAGSYTTGASLTYQTMTFDSSGGAINLEFSSGHNFNSNGNGRGVLFTGTNDVNLSGAGGGIAQSTWISNYLEGADLNISSSFGSTGYLLVGGTGFTNYTGTGLAAGANGEFVLNGGLFRYAPTASVTLTSANHRINSGVFEIGANLNGGGALDLERTTSNFRLTGDSGFSAHGAERKVSLGASVTWGAANFLSNNSNEDADFTFRLSSTRSNATLDFQSKIDLNGRSRTVEVENGSADVDARLSGGLTGTGIASRFVKTGSGTLELTGVNDYGGTTRIEGGRLLVGGGGLTATTAVHVANSTLGLQATEVINNAADITLENGRITTVGDQTETLGRLILLGDNTLDLVGLANVIQMASSADQTWSSSLTILNWNGNAAGNGSDRFFIGGDANGVTSDQLSKIFFVDPEVDGVLQTGTFGASILNTGEIVALIPEPSATFLLAGASLGVLLRRRRRD